MKKYTSIAYSKSLTEGYTTGSLSIEDGQLLFNSDLTGEINFSISSLSMVIQDGQEGLIYFTTPAKDWRFSTTDKSIISETALSQLKLQGLRKDSRKSARRATFVILGILIGFIALMILGFLYFRTKLVNSLAIKVPFHVEQSLGQSYITELMKSDGLDSNSVIIDTLNEKLSTLFHQTDLPFKTFISEDTTMNAFALPGGFLVFNKGMLMNAKSWSEVQGVAAHEMAHVTMKHHSRGMISQVGWVALFGLVFGDGGALSQMVLGTAGQLEQLSYSREFEAEADSKGFEYLSKANIDPQGMIDFFLTLDAKYGAMQQVPEFMSTHPDTKIRIAALQKLVDIQHNNSFRNFGDYESFKMTLINQSNVELNKK